MTIKGGIPVLVVKHLGRSTEGGGGEGSDEEDGGGGTHFERWQD